MTIKVWKAPSLLFPLALVVALLTSGSISMPASAQGSTQTYLPQVGNDVPGVIDDPQWVSPFGVVMYGRLSDDQGLQVMSAAGSRWVTTIFSWSSVQPTAGSPLNWAPYDEQFLAANRAGMDVAVLLRDVPEFARGTCVSSGGCPGMNQDALNNFLRAAAERYDGDGKADAPGSPVVKYWTLFAEPDYCGMIKNDLCAYVSVESHGFKGIFGEAGRSYAQILNRASATIHSVAPDAVVTNGGIAFDAFMDRTTYLPGRYFTFDFMKQVIEGGGAQGMDAMSVHYYPITMPDWGTKIAELYRSAGNATTEAAMRAIPVISPEMGYWSAGDSSEEQQARRLVQMYVRGLANGVQRMAWFGVFDGDPSEPTEAHGLFRNRSVNLRDAKPAYWAYRTMATTLHGYRYSSMYYNGGAGYPFSWDREAYLFSRQADGAQMVVAWSNSGSSLVTFAGAQVSVVNMQGLSLSNQQVPTVSVVTDGSPYDRDGAVNGEVVLQVGLNPMYVRLP